MASGEQAVPPPATKPGPSPQALEQASPKTNPDVSVASRPDPNLSLSELWERAQSRESSLKIRKLLGGTRPIERRAGVIVVDLQEEIRHLLELTRGSLETVLERELGEKVRLEMTPAKTELQESVGQPSPMASESEEYAAIEKNELVRTTMELFDAEIIEIKPTKQQGQKQNR